VFQCHETLDPMAQPLRCRAWSRTDFQHRLTQIHIAYEEGRAGGECGALGRLRDP